MKKSLIVCIVMVLLIPATLFAADGMYDLSIGATAQWQPVPNYSDWESAKEDLMKIDNWSFGLDVRNRLALFGVDLVGIYNYSQPSDDAVHTISVLGTAGVVLDVYDFVRLGIGIGPSMDFIFQNGELQVVDANGSLVTAENVGESFRHAPLTYRLTADFMLGSIMVGANYTLASSWSFAAPSWEGLVPADFGKGKIGVSVLYTLL